MPRFVRIRSVILRAAVVFARGFAVPNVTNAAKVVRLFSAQYEWQYLALGNRNIERIKIDMDLARMADPVFASIGAPASVLRTSNNSG